MFFMKDMRYYPSFFVFTPYFHHLIKKYCFQIKYCFLFYIPPLPFSEIKHNLYVYFFYILLSVWRDTFMASKYRYYDFLQRSHNGMHVISDSFTSMQLSGKTFPFFFTFVLFTTSSASGSRKGRDFQQQLPCQLMNFLVAGQQSNTLDPLDHK